MSRPPKLSPESSSKPSFACTSSSKYRSSLVSRLSRSPPELRPRERVLRGDASRLAPHELLGHDAGRALDEHLVRGRAHSSEGWAAPEGE